MKSALVVFSILLASAASGTTLQISPDGTGEYPTIQDGINNALASGDTILLADGTYEGPGNIDLDFGAMDLTLKSVSGDPALCIIDCGGSAGDPHIGVHIHSGETVHLEGLTIRNAWASSTRQAAVYIEGDSRDDDLTNYPELLLFEGNGNGGQAVLKNVHLVDNEGSGLLALGNGAAATASRSQFNDNSICGAVWSASSTHPGVVDSCQFNGNDLSGLVSANIDPAEYVEFVSCEMKNNLSHGIWAYNYYFNNILLANCEVIGNQGWGCYGKVVKLTEGTLVAHNAAGGVRTKTEGGVFCFDSFVKNNTGPGILASVLSAGGETLASLQLERSEITGNGGEGVFAYGGPNYIEFPPHVLDCTIAANSGLGFGLAFESPYSYLFEISGNDIVDNRDAAISVGMDHFFDIDVTSNIIAFNDGEDISQITLSQLSPKSRIAYEEFLSQKSSRAPGQTGSYTLACNDIYGNLTDFSGPFAPFATIDGNFSQDPLFCDLADSNYALASNSPCAEFSNTACGTIGSLEVECGTGLDEPLISSVLDVPNDQGRKVRLTWYSSDLDTLGSPEPITGYGIYREQKNKSELTAGEPASDDKLFGWDFVESVPARGDWVYQFIAPTLGDSTAADPTYRSTFMVSAMTGSPLAYYDSAPDTGYSADNFSPLPPGMFHVAYASHRNVLTWAASPDTDVAKYRIFRGLKPLIGPLPMDSPYDSTFTNSWEEPIDDPANDAWDYEYWAAAVDFAGNVSDAVLCSDPSSVGDPALPSAFSLVGNVPNPFNPQTSIIFEIPRPASVTLRVVDLSGRLVRDLSPFQTLPAGRHELVWDGRDHLGRRASSGVYFYSVQAGEFRASKSMTLLK